MVLALSTLEMVMELSETLQGGRQRTIKNMLGGVWFEGVWFGGRGGLDFLLTVSSCATKFHCHFWRASLQSPGGKI